MVRPVQGDEVKYTPSEEKQILYIIGKLHGYNAARESKFNRNLNRYYNSGRSYGDANATIWNAGYQSVGYNRSFYDDANLQTRLNVIKSAIDTVVSKLSQARVRPFFDAVRGDYETIKAARAAQIFFDAYFDTQKIYERAPETARGCMLFEGGHFHIEEDQLTILPLPHWEYFVNPYEVNYLGIRGVTIGMIYKREFPFSAIKAMFPKSEKLAEYKDAPIDAVCEYHTVYDLSNNRRWYLCNKKVIYCKKIDYDRIPVTTMWWDPPIVGWSTTCAADTLYTIQVGIDEIQMRIDQAFKRALFNTNFVPVSGEIKTTQVTNEAGLMVEYVPGPGGEGVTTATPPAISDQYRAERDSLIQKAYEFIGVSQLSAQSKKPAGISSGVALQTLEDVESERHNVTVQNYIHQFVEIAELCIEVFPGNADILPDVIGRAKVKWSDIKKQRDTFRVQFSAGSSLAKDPATKIEQIQNLQKLGIDLQPILPQLLEIPDLETAYSATTASYDYWQNTIQKAAENGDIDFLEIADLQMGFRETVRWMLRLSADGGAVKENKKYLENLNALLDAIDAAIKGTEEPALPPVPPAPPVDIPPPEAIPAGPTGGI